MEDDAAAFAALREVHRPARKNVGRAARNGDAVDAVDAKHDSKELHQTDTSDIQVDRRRLIAEHRGHRGAEQRAGNVAAVFMGREHPWPVAKRNLLGIRDECERLTHGAAQASSIL